jgi:hypothetical protein
MQQVVSQISFITNASSPNQRQLLFITIFKKTLCVAVHLDLSLQICLEWTVTPSLKRDPTEFGKRAA